MAFLVSMHYIYINEVDSTAKMKLILLLIEERNFLDSFIIRYDTIGKK